MLKKRKKITQHVDKKIVMRARIFGFISLVFVFILGQDLFNGTISLIYLVGAVIVGIAVGLIASRMYHLSWDKDGKKVIGRFDAIGIAVLIFYIIFAIFREKLVGIFIHGPMVSTATVALMGGLFFGQIVGIRNGVKGILKDEGIIE